MKRFFACAILFAPILCFADTVVPVDSVETHVNIRRLPESGSEVIGRLEQGKADVVFGSRFLGDQPHRVLYYWHYLANKMLTTLSNCFTNLNLTDMETCFKVFLMLGTWIVLWHAFRLLGQVRLDTA
jgi:hypothetical protein